jgi:hypothetical protein
MKIIKTNEFLKIVQHTLSGSGRWLETTERLSKQLLQISLCRVQERPATFFLLTLSRDKMNVLHEHDRKSFDFSSVAEYKKAIEECASRIRDLRNDNKNNDLVSAEVKTLVTLRRLLKEAEESE